MTGRILHFNDHFFHRFPLGLARYGWELLEALREGEGLDVTPVGTWTNLEAGPLEARRRATGALLLEGGRRRWLLRWLLLRRPRLERVLGDFELLHITAPGYPVPTRRPVVVTLHDLGLVTHPAYFGAAYPWLFKAHLRDLVARRASVVAVSAFTADSFRNVVSGAKGLDVRVIHEGVSDVFLEEPDESEARALLAHFDLERPYFLCAGSLNPRKNLGRILDAFEGLQGSIPHDLVLVGSRGWDDEALWARVRRAREAGRIRFVGFVDDRELAALYRLADALLFVSLFEGFGLPAAEAMSCGCPVIASSATSLPEVVGDAGVLVDPTSTALIAASMHRLGTETGFRAELAERGRERAQRFRWADAARSTRELYDDVLERA